MKTSHKVLCGFTGTALLLAYGGATMVSKFTAADTNLVTTLDVSDEAPSEALQVLVAPLKALGMDVKDAAKAASFFNAFADVVERDDSIIKTTADIREGYIRAETLMLQKTEMVGKYPGFGKAKDDVLTETLGLDRVSLTPEKRKKTVDAFRAMAWALGG